MVPSQNKWGQNKKESFDQETNDSKPGGGQKDGPDKNTTRKSAEDQLKSNTIDVDKDEVDKGRVMSEALNNNISSFMPDMMMDKMVTNFKEAKDIYGDSLIRELTGYDTDYVERNMKIPEFKQEIKENMKKNVDVLKDSDMVDDRGFVTEKAYDASAIALVAEELDELEGEGLQGDKKSKEKSIFGDRKGFRQYESSDNYKNINIRQSVSKALKRGRKNLKKEDFMVEEKNSLGNVDVIYAIDSSGSMKGDKVKVAKKAGIALGYEASQNRDKTGLIVFDSEIHTNISPTKDFQKLIRNLARIKTSGETDLSLCLNQAIKEFRNSKNKKHLVILTDAMHTKGEKPEEEVLQQVNRAVKENITITLIGIKLNEKGEELARKIVDRSQGRLYVVNELDKVDGLILQDYYATKD